MSNAELIARANRDRHCMYIAVQERISRRCGDSDDVCAIFTDCISALAAAEIEIERLTKELGSREKSAMSNAELIARIELLTNDRNGFMRARDHLLNQLLAMRERALAAEARVKKLERLNFIYARTE